MDLASIQEMLEAGDKLKVKYRYPRQLAEGESGPNHGIRSDKLVDVSVELKRIYTLFREETPIWLQQDEVIDVGPDDGVYQEFPVS